MAEVLAEVDEHKDNNNDNGGVRGGKTSRPRYWIHQWRRYNLTGEKMEERMIVR